MCIWWLISCVQWRGSSLLCDFENTKNVLLGHVSYSQCEVCVAKNVLRAKILAIVYVAWENGYIQSIAMTVQMCMHANILASLTMSCYQWYRLVWKYSIRYPTGLFPYLCPSSPIYSSIRKSGHWRWEDYNCYYQTTLCADWKGLLCYIQIVVIIPIDRPQWYQPKNMGIYHDRSQDLNHNRYILTVFLLRYLRCLVWIWAEATLMLTAIYKTEPVLCVSLIMPTGEN